MNDLPLTIKIRRVPSVILSGTFFILFYQNPDVRLWHMMFISSHVLQGGDDLGKDTELLQWTVK